MNQNKSKSSQGATSTSNNNNNNFKNNNHSNNNNDSGSKNNNNNFGSPIKTIVGGNNNNNNNNNNSQHDRRNRNQNRPNQSHQQQQQQQQQQHATAGSSQDRQQQSSSSSSHQDKQHHYQNQRDRSSQRNQHPDSSMNRGDGFNNSYNNPSALGSVRFIPGQSTRELPTIETKSDGNKKFTGRCRLFVGNLAHNTSEEKLKTLFEQYGEVGEVFLGPKSAFAFVKMDTRQNAEAARDALDCSTYENRILRVRLAAHAAAIRIKHLSPTVTNELLAYAFRYFGEIERAVVVVDDKGKSIGEGVVEYSRKQSAQYAIKRCQQECFMLTASPMPVLVEPFDQKDEEEGLPEKSVNKNTIEYKEQRDVGPRFAETGSFEHSFALRWKELYDIEKQKRYRLEQEIQEARKNLQDQIEYSKLEHDTMQLRSKLQQMEDNRMKLQQAKDQLVTDSQQRDEQRRQQDLLIRQREEELLRRQQLGDPNGLSQQENALRMQANQLQNLLKNQERASSSGGPPTITIDDDGNNDTNETSPNQNNNNNNLGSMPMNQQPTMLPFQMVTQPRTFADVAMMSHQQQPVGFMTQQHMAMQPPTNQPNMFNPYMPQQQMPMNPVIQYQPPPQQHQPQQQQQQQPHQHHHQTRQSKYNSPGNNINVSTQPQRPRKRGRF